MRLNGGQNNRENVIVNVSDYFDDAFASGYPLGESYDHLRLKIHIHFALISHLDGKTGYYCLVFHCPFRYLDPARNNREVVFRPRHIKDQSATCCARDMQESMFIDIGKDIKLPKRMEVESSAILEGLQPLDRCLRRWLDSSDALKRALEHRRPASCSTVPVFVPDNRELRTLCDVIGKRIGMSVCDGQSEHEMVQTAAKVVQDVTKQQSEWIARNFVGFSLEEEIRRVIFVGLTPGGVVIRFEPVVDFEIQLIQVMKRALEFEPRSSQDIRRHGTTGLST